MRFMNIARNRRGAAGQRVSESQTPPCRRTGEAARAAGYGQHGIISMGPNNSERVVSRSWEVNADITTAELVFQNRPSSAPCSEPPPEAVASATVVQRLSEELAPEPRVQREDVELRRHPDMRRLARKKREGAHGAHHPVSRLHQAGRSGRAGVHRRFGAGRSIAQPTTSSAARRSG